MRRSSLSMHDVIASLIIVAALGLAFWAGWHFSRLAPKLPDGMKATSTSESLQRGNANPQDKSSSPGRYLAQVLHVIDGDTVEARVFVWPGHEILTKIRLRGIDAPEIRGACGPEIKQAEAARDRLKALIGQQKIWLTEIGPDKYYGRVVARLLTAGPDQPVDAGGVLIAEKLARPYSGKRRESWCVLAGG